ncbi:MAG: hypothetical protein LBE21_01100 [Pseudomonadales bacterium]|jgi:thiol:disulfide interchange protein DsbD|nr:hypothetical protein [Pseudomonadales bacterium]
MRGGLCGVLSLAFLLSLSLPPSAAAQLQTAPTLGAGQNAPAPLVPGILPVEQAFALSAFVEADTSITLRWEMPEGYYLYRKSLRLELPDGGALDDFDVPQGTLLNDEYFGDSEVYFTQLLLRLPLGAVPDNAYGNTAQGARQLEFTVYYQGCAQGQYCYPPRQTPLVVELP